MSEKGEPEPEEPQPSAARRHLRKAARLGAGGGLVVAGLLMTVLPGPAIVFIPLGLGVLASEIPWLRRRLKATLVMGEKRLARVDHRHARRAGRFLLHLRRRLHKMRALRPRSPPAGSP